MSYFKVFLRIVFLENKHFAKTKGILSTIINLFNQFLSVYKILKLHWNSGQ